jgi:hypothetical protein
MGKTADPREGKDSIRSCGSFSHLVFNLRCFFCVFQPLSVMSAAPPPAAVGRRLSDLLSVLHSSDEDDALEKCVEQMVSMYWKELEPERTTQAQMARAANPQVIRRLVQLLARGPSKLRRQVAELLVLLVEFGQLFPAIFEAGAVPAVVQVLRSESAANARFYCFRLVRPHLTLKPPPSSMPRATLTWMCMSLFCPFFADPRCRVSIQRRSSVSVRGCPSAHHPSVCG